MTEVNVLPTRNRDRIKIEALVVPEVSQVQNEHIEVVKYPYQQGLWFSDMSKIEETLNIDIPIWSDYLCYHLWL